MRNKPNQISWDDGNRLYNIESKDIIHILESNNVEVKNISPAGSLRRKRHKVGDLDIVIEVDNPKLSGKVLEDKMNYKFIAKNSFYKGKILNTGIDLFIAGHHNYYSMLFFLTGCEDWNLRIMKYLNSNTDIRYTPFKFVNAKSKKVYKFNSEKEIFKLINHNYILPINRKPNYVSFGD
ncbi:MAG: hypothetical protein CMD08_01485 [Flavobacteriales bacterium]|nr:hypothetical protein [Flavobacteriales bacterium]